MKVAVVTGASSGVGAEISRRFVSLGWRVYGLARNENRLKVLSTDLGKEFVPIVCDVRVISDVSNAFMSIGQVEQHIDLLVNNAAVFKMAPFKDFSLTDIDSIIDTNLKGSLYCTHASMSLLTKGSRIIQIGSVAGTRGIASQAVYCASKYGIDGFSEALNQELIDSGISITTICPGGIDTPLWKIEDNPYPGNLSKILTSNDVVDLVEHVANLPCRVVLKKIVLFPSNEWH